MRIRTDFIQGSAQWALARCGRLTASELHNLISPTFEIRKGQTPRTYLATKLAEKWRGKPIDTFGSWDTEQGQILETEARPWLSFTLGCDFQTVGLCEHDELDIACSPDGLLTHSGAEIKCCQPVNHMKYLLAGVVPDEYTVQVQTSLFVTGLPSWIFCCYHRDYPKLVLTVKPIKEAQDRIAQVIESFGAEMRRGMDRLEELADVPA